jgi:cell wall-associated NlpC family hydrolase
MPKLDEDQRSYNPGELHAAEQFPEGYVTGGLDQLGAHANDPANRTKNEPKDTDQPSVTANADAARLQEAEPSFVSRVTEGGRRVNRINFKKKGPLAAIIALFFGGGFASFMLFSPGIAIVQFTEVLIGDLNDQVRAMDTLDNELMRAKLGSIQSGVCGNVLSIRCKFSTMSEKEVQRFRDAGIEVEPDEPNRNFGRTKPTKLIFPDGTEVTNPNELRASTRNNPALLSYLRTAFNPKFAGMYDEIARRVFASFKTDRSQKVKGDTEEERNASIDAATAGERAGIDANGYRTDEEDRHYVVNDEGTRVYETDTGNLPAGSIVDSGQFNQIVDENLSLLDNIAEQANAADVGKNAFGNLLDSARAGLSLTGALDTACTINNTIRALSAAAKVARALQLAQYFVVFANVAHRIKAGVATPEEVEDIGERLTTPDTREMIVDESSIWDGEEPEPHENEYYGANAFDSAGYHVAAYNAAPILTSQDQQFLIGGGIAGTLSSVMDNIATVLGGRENIRSTCKVVQSWWVRSIGLVAGLVSAVGSFGVTTGVSIGASIAMGFVMPFLQAMLADVIEGKTVDSSTRGPGTGSGGFAGAAALFGALAGGHGMTASSKSEFKDYLAATEQVNQDRIAAETYEAQKTPFDVYNQYSFLGSFVRTINPTLTKSTASISGALQSIPSLLGTAASSVFPSVNATVEFNPERFERCEDAGYEELGIDADVFCNVRFSMSAKQLSTTPDESASYMIDNGHINEDGSAKSDDYKDWITYCAERKDGYGETSDDEPSDPDAAIGLSCVRKGKDDSQLEKLEQFGTYHMYASLQSTKETGYVTGGSGAGGTQASAATPEICKTMAANDLGQIACQAYQFDDYGYLWAGGHGGSAEGFMRDFDAGKYEAGHDQILDCSGLVRMSIYEATGIDTGTLSTHDYPGYSKFQSIPKDQAKAGDIIWKSSPGHTEIIVSNDTSAQQYETFGAHTANTSFNKQIGPSSYSYGDVEKVFRFQP